LWDIAKIDIPRLKQRLEEVIKREGWGDGI